MQSTKLGRRCVAALLFGLLFVVPSFANAKQCNGNPTEEYTTLNGVENGGQALRSVGPDLANLVVAPPTCDIFIYGVVLEVKLERRDLGSFDVFYSEINHRGQPYDVHVLGTISDSSLTRDFKRIEVLSDSFPVLKAGGRYHFGIRKHVGALSTVILGNTVDPSVLQRQNVETGGYFYNIKGQQPNINGVYEMHVIIL